jgi:hypothetical protein
MTRMRLFSIGLLVALLASLPTRPAQAADTSGTPGTGTILSITFSTDTATSITTVLVTYQDDANQVQKARISLETAITLELIIPNAEMIGQNVEIEDPADPAALLTSGPVTGLVFVTDSLTGITSLEVSLTDLLTNEPIVVNLDLATALEMGLIAANEEKISIPPEFEPDDVLESGSYPRVLSMLGTFFGTSPGVTLDQLTAYREAGFGYGVIAQACWLATTLGGDATLLDQILTAKSTGDFSAIILPDGTSVVNWGQLRHAVNIEHGQNLGSIVSGRADDQDSSSSTEASAESRDHGKGHRQDRGNGHRNGNGGQK